MEHILDNAYTNRDFEYLKSKNVEVCIIIQHKVTKEISMRSSVPLIDVKSMLQKADRDKNNLFGCQNTKENISLSPMAQSSMCSTTRGSW